MIPNVSTNGVAFGYVAANDLDGDVVAVLLGHDLGANVKNLSYDAAMKEAEAEQRAKWENNCETLEVAHQEAGTVCGPHPDFEFDEQAFNDGYNHEEDVVEGVYEGITYRTSWLGGALNFWIFNSPLITTAADRGSPCIPNAAVLLPPWRRSGIVLGFDVPADWWHRSEGDSLRDWCNGEEEDFM